MRNFYDASTYGSFIDGKFHTDPPYREHKSLLSQKSWKKIAYAKDAQIDLAIQSAESGLLQMRSLTAYQRAFFLKKIAEQLLEQKEAIAELITNEMGKPIREARGEVEYAAGYFDWFSEEAKRIYGYSIASDKPEKWLQVRYHSVGIVAVITPWNFPIAMAARKIAAALAAGCSVLARPSSSTPLSLLCLGAIAQKIGLPEGALNILIGDGEKIAQRILQTPQVRKLTFTGSCQTGEKLYRLCTPTFKKVTLELGGHAPLLIFEDADLKQAVQETIRAKFRISGQTCICANRILVQNTILSSFLKLFKNEVEQMRVGNPMEESSDLSNILHPTSNEKVKHHVEDALKKGAKCLLGGGAPWEPTILSDISTSMILFREETFGPVAGVTGFLDEAQAIELANDSIYGLASYVFTQDLNRAERVISQLEYGIVGLNDGLPSAPHVPFGGIKYSGFGREGGPKGIFEYLTEKLISQKIY